jgi:hypothetical protein
MDDNSSDADSEQLRREVMERRSLSFLSDAQLESLHGYVRRLKAAHLDKEEYLDARDASELMEYCRWEIQFRRGQPVPPAVDRDPQSTTARQALIAYERRLSDHNEQLGQRLAELETKHEKELREFEVKWRDVMPDRYRKPSKLLLEMRYTMQNLAQAEYFEEAQARKEEVERLARQEVAAAQLRLNHDYQTARQRLVARQQEEVGQVNEQAKMQRALLITKKTGAQRAIGNRQTVLETKPMFKKKAAIRAAVVATTAARRVEKENPEPHRLPPLRPPNALIDSEQQQTEHNRGQEETHQTQEK